MEEHLHLHAAPALSLLARRLLPDLTGTPERVARLARAMELFQTVPAAEQAEMIGGKRSERAVIPAQCLGPLLLALEVPTDGAVEHRRPARSELGAAQQISLDLVLVPEHPERPTDLVQQLGRVPGLALGRVVEAAVSGHDRLQVAAVA